MAKCYLMLEDQPAEQDGEMSLGWAISWGTDDGLQPTGDELMTDAQLTLTMLLAALENGVNKSQQPMAEPSRILLLD